MDSTPSTTDQTIALVGRLGYGARALLYGAVGLLAVFAAISGRGGSDAKGSSETMALVNGSTFGKALVFATAAGLVAYAAWQLVRAAFDPENEGSDGGGVVKRVAYAISALIHAALAVAAVQIGLGESQGRDDAHKTWISDVLTWPGGGVVIAAVGLGIGAYGVYQLHKAGRSDLKTEWHSERIPGWLRKSSTRIARVGLGARGVVFLLMAGFVGYAGISSQASEARGMGETLRELAQQTWGTLLLVLAGAGLFAFALYQLILAVYRKMPG